MFHNNVNEQYLHTNSGPKEPRISYLAGKTLSSAPKDVTEENPLVKFHTTELTNERHATTMELVRQHSSDGMTLIVGVPCENGELIVASDSRSTQKLSDGQYSFSDTEQKIFPIENSPILFAVSGANRFAPKNMSLANLAYALKGNNDIEAVIAAIEKRLMTYSFLQTQTKILVVDVTCPSVFAVIQLQNNCYKHVWEYVHVGDSIAIGCEWCLHIAWGYQYNIKTGLTAAQSVKALFDMLYMQAKLLTVQNQLIAPPTQIYLGNSLGEIKTI